MVHNKFICFNDDCKLHKERACLNHHSSLPDSVLNSKSKHIQRVKMKLERNSKILMCWIYIHDGIK